MKKEQYQEALDELECYSIQWVDDYVDNEAADKMLNHSKLLQQLIDEKLEQESRKDKLVVGSEWECVFECFGENRHYDVKDNVVINKIFNLYGTYINVGHGQIDDNIPEQQFLLCFKPRKVEVE
jgi:hypothetical protein